MLKRYLCTALLLLAFTASIQTTFANNYDFYMDKAHAYFKDKKYSETIKACDNAINLNPNDAKAYYQRAYAKNHLGKYDEATKDYNKSVELQK